MDLVHERPHDEPFLQSVPQNQKVTAIHTQPYSPAQLLGQTLLAECGAGVESVSACGLVEPPREQADADGRGQRVFALIVGQSISRPRQIAERPQDPVDLILLAGGRLQSREFFQTIGEG